MGAFNLAFAPQTSSQVISSAGLRGQHAVLANQGYLKLQGHIEYSQQMNDDGSARMGYAALCTE
ncbi:MAG: autotransporter domain-containing protein [Pantoea sp.]|uniref:hypothetical protein n=1 Tax=Pantoea sp. TaxID=69393 RepID=UPI0039E25E08